MQTLRDTYRRSRWFMPAFALALGVVFFVAQWIGDDPSGGLVSLAIMAAFAAVLVLLESRSGAVAILRRPARDERTQHRPGGDRVLRHRAHHGRHRSRDGAARPR